jgi:hypothetical protein
MNPMKNIITVPLALLLVALTLSGCFYGPRHGFYGGGGYGGYQHGPGPGGPGPGPGGYNHP